jgi:ABC-type uncharacterized transport system permease subunit
MEAIGKGPIHRARGVLNLSLQKYSAIMRVSIANNLAYVMEVFFRALLLVVLVFILGQLWKTTFSARGVTVLDGFSITDMVWYLVVIDAHNWDMSIVPHSFHLRLQKMTGGYKYALSL